MAGSNKLWARGVLIGILVGLGIGRIVVVPLFSPFSLLLFIVGLLAVGAGAIAGAIGCKYGGILWGVLAAVAAITFYGLVLPFIFITTVLLFYPLD